MSLVEQALKKARASGTSGPVANARPSSGPTTPPASTATQSTAERRRDVIEPSGETTDAFRVLRRISIDFDYLRRAGYLPPPEQEREVSEQFRHIKRPLLARAFGRGMAPVANGRVIMVSSALPGDGKTFCAINLARSLCLESDSSVLLVDTDTAKPQATRALGLLDEPGLLDALQDETIDVESLVSTTDAAKLSVLPAGRGASEIAAELLGSARMEQVLGRLTSCQAPNRIVLLDAPPLLVTNEAKTLVDHAGQVVLVVRASTTPQSAVLDAISHLREDQFVGIVLNESDTVAGVGYGYGYYGRMYKYGQAAEERQGRDDDNKDA